MKQNSILKLLIAVLILLQGCGKKNESEFTKHPNGFYYHLVSFVNDVKKDNTHFIAVLDVDFATQKDSVFWSSKSDFDNKFYVQIDPENSHNFIETYLQQANEGDSVCLLLPRKAFFKQQFFTERLPSFNASDSVVKVNMKVTALFNTSRIDSLLFEWAKNEGDLIKKYLASNHLNNYYKDSLNVYWLNGRPDKTHINALKDKTISMTYKGYLLNGKQFDESPANWQVNPSTPDQMLKGLNYVIKFLNKGENAKIILPSYLAFGELGTGNIIPPFTPLVYEISINDIVN